MNSVMRLLSRLTTACSRLLDTHMVDLQGIPFSYRVLLNPVPLIKVLSKYGIKGGADDIELEIGEIDNIAGKTDMNSGKVIVDVQEIALKKVPDGDPDRIDYEVTKTLAHEIRHRWQLQTKGKFRMLWDKIALFALFSVVGVYFIWYPLARYDVRLLFSGEPHLIAFSLLAGYFLFRFFLVYISMAALVSYRMCWCERDARQFAEKVANDPEWRDVVTVQVRNAMDPGVNLTPDQALHQLFRMLLGNRRPRVI